MALMPMHGSGSFLRLLFSFDYGSKALRLVASASCELVDVTGGPVFEGQWRTAGELGHCVGGHRGFAIADILEGLGYACGDGCGDSGADHVFGCGLGGDVDDTERAVDEARENVNLLRGVDELASGEVVSLG